MTLFVLMVTPILSMIIATIMVRCRLLLKAIPCLVPLFSTIITFMALWTNYTLFEMGPFIIVPFGLAFLLSVLVAFAICWHSLSRA